jgi:hypothetical protein
MAPIGWEKTAYRGPACGIHWVSRLLALESEHAPTDCSAVPEGEDARRRGTRGKTPAPIPVGETSPMPPNGSYASCRKSGLFPSLPANPDPREGPRSDAVTRKNRLFSNQFPQNTPAASFLARPPAPWHSNLEAR